HGAQQFEAGAGDHQNCRGHGQAPSRKDQAGAGDIGAGLAQLGSRRGNLRVILNTTKSESDSLSGLRKAAMLLVVLGEHTSADLLQHLTEDEVQKVSREVAGLTSIPSEQAELVLQEFHHISTAGDYVARG